MLLQFGVLRFHDTPSRRIVSPPPNHSPSIIRLTPPPRDMTQTWTHSVLWPFVHLVSGLKGGRLWTKCQRLVEQEAQKSHRANGTVAEICL